MPELLERMRPARLRYVALLCCVVAQTAGCGVEAGGVKASGTVTYQGRPLPNGAITFVPAAGKPISASLDPEGRYSLRLPPGDYRVVLAVGFEVPEGWKEGDPPPRQSFVLPPQYGSITRTPLAATVTEDHREPINFDLQ